MYTLGIGFALFAKAEEPSFLGFVLTFAILGIVLVQGWLGMMIYDKWTARYPERHMWRNVAIAFLSSTIVSILSLIFISAPAFWVGSVFGAVPQDALTVAFILPLVGFAAVFLSCSLFKDTWSSYGVMNWY